MLEFKKKMIDGIDALVRGLTCTIDVDPLTSENVFVVMNQRFSVFSDKAFEDFSTAKSILRKLDVEELSTLLNENKDFLLVADENRIEFCDTDEGSLIRAICGFKDMYVVQMLGINVTHVDISDISANGLREKLKGLGYDERI